MKPAKESWLSDRVEALKPSATGEMDNEVHRLREEGVKDLVSLAVGEPKFDTPENIKRAARKALEEGKTNYEPTAGDFSLREAVSRKLDEENRISASPEEIIVTPGAKFGIYLAFMSVLEEKDKVMIIDPAWVTYEPAAKIAGAEALRVSSKESEGFHPDLEKIERKIDRDVKMVVINSPCNPTGAVYEKEEIKKITHLARENSALVLSDEPYEYLVFDGEHYSPGSDFDNVITVNSFSKSFAMTGWRLGYVTAPKSVIKGMKKIYQHSVSCVTSFAQAGALEALESEESKREVRSMMEAYEKRRDLMLDLIGKSDYLDQRSIPEGAFYCFPSYSIDVASKELAKRLLVDYHVATVPGVAFGGPGEGHLRLSYSYDLETIKEALRRIEEFFRGY